MRCTTAPLGAAEGRKFEDWYARTLDDCAAAFGTLPPADIWPAAAGPLPETAGMDLRSIAMRVEMPNARLLQHSAPGHGTHTGIELDHPPA